jgi:hypothetical protein
MGHLRWSGSLLSEQGCVLIPGGSGSKIAALKI